MPRIEMKLAEAELMDDGCLEIAEDRQKHGLFDVSSCIWFDVANAQHRPRPHDGDADMTDEEFLAELDAIFRDLLSRQEPLGDEFMEILNENMYDLYEE